MPYLKTSICRIVSIASVIRTEKGHSNVALSLTSLPHNVDDPKQTAEAEIISRFPNAVGDKKTQLVGFNSANADLKILVQRVNAISVQAAKFAKRSDKPWENYDYFDARNSEGHIDLVQIQEGFGKSSPSLNEMTAVCGISGKLGIIGQ